MALISNESGNKNVKKLQHRDSMAQLALAIPMANVIFTLQPTNLEPKGPQTDAHSHPQGPQDVGLGFGLLNAHHEGSPCDMWVVV